MTTKLTEDQTDDLVQRLTFYGHSREAAALPLLQYDYLKHADSFFGGYDANLTPIAIKHPLSWSECEIHYKTIKKATGVVPLALLKHYSFKLYTSLLKLKPSTWCLIEYQLETDGRVDYSEVRNFVKVRRTKDTLGMLELYPVHTLSVLCPHGYPTIGEYLVPAFPLVFHPPTATLLLAGWGVEKVVKAIYGNAGDLTAAECKQWLLETGGVSVCGWVIAKELGVSRLYPDFPGIVKTIRGFTSCVLVARWLCQVYKRSPQRLRWSWARKHEERLRSVDWDEITPKDIHHPKEGVERVLDRVVKRKLEASTFELEPYPWEHLLPEGVTALRTGKAIYQEGEEMSHCAAGYASRVKECEIVLLSLKTEEGCSTVELHQGWNVEQHKGYDNATPPRPNEELLETTLSILKLSKLPTL